MVTPSADGYVRMALVVILELFQLSRLSFFTMPETRTQESRIISKIFGDCFIFEMSPDGKIELSHILTGIPGSRAL